MRVRVVGIMTWTQTERSGVRIRPGAKKNFSHLQNFQMASDIQPAAIQLIPAALSLEVQRPGREADHSPPSSDEVKSEWNYTSTPPIRVHSVYRGNLPM